MNHIDFTRTGGFRATQKTWKFVQDNYNDAFAAFAALCGDNVIVTGVEEVISGELTDGWIVYQGELIRFVGGTKLTEVFIEETADQILLNDTEVPFDAYFTKVAKCGVPGDFLLSDLKPLNTLHEMWLKYDVKEVDCPPSYITANFDSTGLGINERKGWAVCNGANGTKKRDGRVSVGYTKVTIDPVDNVWDVIYNTVGSTGGEKKHQLSLSELPNFTFEIPRRVGDLDRGGNSSLFSLDNEDKIDIGSDAPHENRQPFIVTLFIQKL